MPSSPTRPEGQQEQMSEVAAGDRSDEEHPGERLERVTVPPGEHRYTDGGADRPADDQHGVDQPPGGLDLAADSVSSLRSGVGVASGSGAGWPTIGETGA